MTSYKRYWVHVAIVIGCWFMVIFFFALVMPTLLSDEKYPYLMNAPEYKEAVVGGVTIAFIVVHLFLSAFLWFWRKDYVIKVLLMSALIMALIGGGICSQAYYTRSERKSTTMVR